MAEYWIKLHTSSLDSSVFADDFVWRLWCWCLLKANFRDRTFKGQLVKRGQFVTGRAAGSGDLGCSQSKWMRGISKLVELDCITTTSNSKWTTITICNYSTYQDKNIDDRTANGQPADSQRTTGDTTSGQPADTRAEVRSTESKSKSVSENTETPSANGSQKRKRTTTDTTPDFEEFWKAYPPRNGQRLGKKAAFAEWLKIDQEKRPLIAGTLDRYRTSLGPLNPKDAERFLRDGTWSDLLESPNDPEETNPFRPLRPGESQSLPSAETLANFKG